MVDGQSSPSAGTSLDMQLAGARHLLGVADDVTLAEVEALALSRYAEAAWVSSDVLALAEHVYLSGPFAVDAPQRETLNLPTWVESAYLLTCPPDRGAPVPEELRSVGGLLAAFAQASVQGAELAAVEVLCAMGRRLGAVVRTSTGYLLEPAPTAGVDLVVHSPVWLHPDALIHVLRQILPSIRLLTEVEEAPAPRPRNLGQALELDDGERAWLHAEADAFDSYTLSEPEVTEVYGSFAPFPDGGQISAAVEAEQQVPPVLADHEWVTEGTITYALRWYPADPEALHEGRAGKIALDQREESRELIEACARAIVAAVGGEVTDDDHFLVQP